MNIIDARHSIPHSNYSMLNTQKIGIVYHITADNRKGQCLNWFRNSAARVSAHYIVEPDGDIVYCVDVKYKAYHAGIVRKPIAKIIRDNEGINPNNFMIGIEVVSNGNDLTKEQYIALCSLTEKLTKEQNIPLNRYRLIGHNEVNSVDKYFCPRATYNVKDIIEIIKHKREITELKEIIRKKESSVSSLRKRLKRFIQTLRS